MGWGVVMLRTVCPWLKLNTAERRIVIRGGQRTGFLGCDLAVIGVEFMMFRRSFEHLSSGYKQAKNDKFCNVCTVLHNNKLWSRWINQDAEIQTCFGVTSLYVLRL